MREGKRFEAHTGDERGWPTTVTAIHVRVPGNATRGEGGSSRGPQ